MGVSRISGNNQAQQPQKAQGGKQADAGKKAEHAQKKALLESKNQQISAKGGTPVQAVHEKHGLTNALTKADNQLSQLGNKGNASPINQSPKMNGVQAHG